MTVGTRGVAEVHRVGSLHSRNRCEEAALLSLVEPHSERCAETAPVGRDEILANYDAYSWWQ
jgi:hypothetical protein